MTETIFKSMNEFDVLMLADLNESIEPQQALSVNDLHTPKVSPTRLSFKDLSISPPDHEASFDRSRNPSSSSNGSR